MQLGQVTKVFNEVKKFDPMLHSIHVLRSHREYLNNAMHNHQAIVNSLMDHEDADFTEIEESIDKFRVAHSNAMCHVEELMEKAKAGTRDDSLAALQAQIDAVIHAFYEFKFFITNESNDQVPASELKFRMKDLQQVQHQFLDLWSKMYALQDDTEKELWKLERAKFNTDFYKTMSWFDARVNPAASSGAGTTPRAPRTTTEPKLPKIELPTFDGQPVNWVSFRDSYKALVHDVTTISKAIKFRYLKSSINDKFSPIKHLLESEDGYEDAWLAVLDYYDDERRIADSHFAEMLNVKPMEAENHDELQRVLNDFSLHTASLERMKDVKTLYSAFLAHLVLQRLDNHTRDLWETENCGDIPLWKDLQQFLKDRRKALSTMTPTASPPEPPPAPLPVVTTKPVSRTGGRIANAHTASTASNSFKSKNKCYLCSGDHRLSACQQFIELPVASRQMKIAELRICSNCFASHDVSSCSSEYKCRVCQGKHHTMLHSAVPATTATSLTLQAQPAPRQDPGTLPLISRSCNTSSRHRSGVTLLQTAMIQVQDASGEWHSIRAFLDSGSDSNFITRSAAEALRIPFESVDVHTSGLGATTAAIIHHKITACVGTVSENFHMELFVLKKIIRPTPPSTVNAESLGIPSNLQLADPTFNVPGKIDLLIGNGFFGAMLREGIIRLASGPTMINTIAGWLISGTVRQLEAIESNGSTTDERFSASLQRDYTNSTCADSSQPESATSGNSPAPCKSTPFEDDRSVDHFPENDQLEPAEDVRDFHE